MDEPDGLISVIHCLELGDFYLGKFIFARERKTNADGKESWRTIIPFGEIQSTNPDQGAESLEKSVLESFRGLGDLHLRRTRIMLVPDVRNVVRLDGDVYEPLGAEITAEMLRVPWYENTGEIVQVFIHGPDGARPTASVGPSLGLA